MSDENKIVILDISSIKVVNPRARSKAIHGEITKNIQAVGLKKPITVRKLDDDEQGFQYALICGQGRLESLLALGQKEVPAIVKQVDAKTGHVMSLVENIARRKPRSTELFQAVKDLKYAGLSDAETGKRLGYSATWVNNIMMLLDKGEKLLLGAFESGRLPLSIAVSIAKANDAETQKLLLEAYNNHQLTNRQLAHIKKIIASRAQGNKGSVNLAYVQHKTQKRLTADELMDVYKKNIEEHKILQRKSEFVQESLLLARQMISELLKEGDFVAVLKNESLNNIPTQILRDLSSASGDAYD